MSEDYILLRDIVYDHKERMQNLKKYYPYFKLAEISFVQYKEGRYADLDMGYILMAVLRFFIEENNFREKEVSFEEYRVFLHEILVRDFELQIPWEEEEELISYIFDKITNEGKPFLYSCFDPATKKKHTMRMRFLEGKMKEGKVCYTITADAIEFYLDTKEIKDESSISVAQVLLGKMISSRNFKGGTEVVRRINHEVSRLMARKDEVLSILSYDIFAGVKAYEEFVDTGMKWFEDEQKLFDRNKALIEQALERAKGEEQYFSAMEDIYHLEQELKKAITRHSELLNACTDLQKKTDEMVALSKVGRLRSSFDFKEAVKNMMEDDRADLLQIFVQPILKLQVKKMFSLSQIDQMLSIRADRKEVAEKVKEVWEEDDYRYEDEIEEERIFENGKVIVCRLLDFLLQKESFDLEEWNRYLYSIYGDELFINGDYYAVLVHMCQKKKYDLAQVKKSPDTFFEKMMNSALEESGHKYDGMVFSLEMRESEPIQMQSGFEISNVIFQNGQAEGRME